MTQKRKSAESRERDLRLALLRIKRGRSHCGTKRVTIAAVAREAGVSAALIHNHYPGIAEAIRVEQGRESRVQRDAKQQELKLERQRARELRQEVLQLRNDVERLSTINEVLRIDNEALRARLNDKLVVVLKPPGAGQSGSRSG